MSIYYARNDTSTYNMSFYVQVITHTKSSHVMAICTHKLIMCQYIRTHILTSKHVTLSQAMTLSNKSYNGHEASHNNHKPGQEIDPKHAINIGLTRSQARLGVAYLRLGGPKSLPISSSSLLRHAYRLGGPLRLGKEDPFLPGEAPFPRLGEAQFA